jgi:hypothetical protein
MCLRRFSKTGETQMGRQGFVFLSAPAPVFHSLRLIVIATAAPQNGDPVLDNPSSYIHTARSGRWAETRTSNKPSPRSNTLNLRLPQSFTLFLARRMYGRCAWEKCTYGDEEFCTAVGALETYWTALDSMFRRAKKRWHVLHA